MKDDYRIAYFDFNSELSEGLSTVEVARIQATIPLVPREWKRIIDVGCGDGRVSRELIKSCFKVTGIDWSNKSVEHFPGFAYVSDIRSPWPITEPFDGAICCEVLEHLQPDEARKVIAQISSNITGGFLITVPAHENLESNTVDCQQCGRAYHIWGHCQTFKSFEDVDLMVGLPSKLRVHINPGRGRRSNFLQRWPRYLGQYPYHPAYVCPHCGTHLKPPESVHIVNRLLLKGIAAINRLAAPFQPKGGWFACRYNM